MGGGIQGSTSRLVELREMSGTVPSFALKSSDALTGLISGSAGDGFVQGSGQS